MTLQKTSAGGKLNRQLAMQMYHWPQATVAKMDNDMTVEKYAKTYNMKVRVAAVA